MAKQLYFIAIELPQPYKEDIQQWKKELSEKYHSKHALKTPPHITLQMPMRIEAENENALIESLDKLDNRITSDSVELKNISSFTPRTIFIEVESNEFVVELYREVQENLQLLDFISDKVPIPSFHPHVTLMTRDLSKSNFKAAWEELKGREYNETIDIHSFHLYKHDGKFWRVLREFILKT